MTDLALRREAAKTRAEQVRAAVDRPSQRRGDEHAGALPLVRLRSKLELRDSGGGDGALNFHGVASATDKPYTMYDMFGPYTEIVLAGAFGKTLAQPDLDVPLVLAHDSLRRIARTTNGSLVLAETSEGLEVDAPNLDREDGDVAYIAPKIRSGLVDEMSFRFRITSGQWSPDFMEYHIEEVDIDRGDVAIVGYGANPHTSSELRSRAADTVELAQRSDAFIVDQYRQLRGELRQRGLKPPMSLEDAIRA